jgi:hypothetical protein
VIVLLVVVVPSMSRLSPAVENEAATKCQAPLLTVAAVVSSSIVVPVSTPKVKNPEGSTQSIRSALADEASVWFVAKPMIDPPVVDLVLNQATSVNVEGEVSELIVPTYEVVAPVSAMPVEVNAELTGDVKGAP